MHSHFNIVRGSCSCSLRRIQAERERDEKKKKRNIKYYALNFLIATAARNPAKSFRRCNVFEFKRILGNIVLLLYGMHLAGTIAAGNNGNGCT